MGDAHGARPLTINGQTSMPSAVMLLKNGSWHVGHLAVNAARLRLESFEATPKSAIPQGNVSLGGRNVPVVDAVAAVLRFVVGEAQKLHRSRAPVRFVVTHPAGWPPKDIAVLVAAGKKAAPDTWPQPKPLAEPVAAAQGVLGRGDVPSWARIVVLDMGGGTIDVATVNRNGAQLEVVGDPKGITEAGGEEFDLRLARHMAKEAGEDGLYDKLAASTDPRHNEMAMDLRNLARLVKEQLSVEAVVPIEVVVPTDDGTESRPVQVTRDQLQTLIIGGNGKAVGLGEAVDLAVWARDAETTCADAPPQPPFAGVYLVGGPERLSLDGFFIAVAAALGRRLPRLRLPLRPGTAVAVGAADWARRDAGLDVPEEKPPVVQPPIVQPPIVVPPPEPGPLRRLLDVLAGNRPLLGAVVVALVVGGLTWALIPPAKPTSPSTPPTSTSTSTPPPPEPVPVGVRGCTTAGTPDCKTAILSASRSVWPGMPTDRCTAKEARYGVDLYSAECITDTVSYDVFWRKESGSILRTLAGQMITPKLSDFRLPDDPALLGLQVGGTRRTPSGWRFTCVWEYADYPVTLVLDGPNDGDTAAVCGSAGLLGSTAMESAMRER